MEGLGLGHWLMKSWHWERGESEGILDGTEETFAAAGAKWSRLDAISPSVGVWTKEELTT